MATSARYALTDTPNFEVDVTLPDGTPTTPLGATCVVTDQKLRTPVAGSPAISINGNRVIVVIPASMVYAGRFVAEAQVQLDAVPTLQTATYEYIVRGAE